MARSGKHLVTSIRTVLGDIEPEDLGPTYAHEHLVIDRAGFVEPAGLPARRLSTRPSPSSTSRVRSASPRSSTRCRAAGRNVVKLAEASRRSGVHVVASTGLHLSQWYPADGWTEHESADSSRPVSKPTSSKGSTPHDYRGAFVERSEHRAGVIKIAGSAELTDRERRVYEAAAAAHARTGCPILTHCTDGLCASNRCAARRAGRRTGPA